MSSPVCCDASTEYRTVTIFVPASRHSESHWAAPFRNEEGEVAKGGVTRVQFCPFCGVRLTRQHLRFGDES